MARLSFKFLAIIGLILSVSTLGVAQQNKPIYKVDEQTLSQHIPFIEQSVDLGLPFYDFNYSVNSLGEFETERTGEVTVKRLADKLVDDDGRVTFVYEILAPFVGDEGSTGQLFCEAYVTMTKAGALGYKPAICGIYEWDDERLWDE